ncbi:MAG: YfhO family protein [Acidobacteria bacterium]|nr:YfhO family protein [Acidobacteriota bacterium]
MAIYILGAGLSAFQLLPTFELATRSVRNKLTYSDFVGVSLPFGSLLTSLFSTRLHILFQNDGSESMLDVGALVLLLAALGVCLSPSRYSFWIFLCVFSTLLFVGSHTPLCRAMFYIPGYNLFYAGVRNGIALDFAVVMLAAHGLDALRLRKRLRDPAKSTFAAAKTKHAAILLLIPAVYYGSIFVMEERIFRQLHEQFILHGKPLPWTLQTARDQLLPVAPEIAIMALGMGALVLLLLKSGGGRATAGVLIGLVATHFWMYRTWIFAAPANEVERSLNWNIQENTGFRDPGLKDGRYRVAAGSPHNWIDFLADDPRQWRRRYLAIEGADINMLHGISSVSGYTPLIPRDYSRLAGDMHMSGYIRDAAFFSSSALNLLNIKYVLVPGGNLSFPPETFSTLELVFNSDLVIVYRNPQAPGMFWGVQETKVFTPEKFWAELDRPAIDFSRTAFLTGKRNQEIGSRRFELPKAVTFYQRDGNRVEVSVETPREAFLASSHLNYPGWFAWIDGRRTTIYPVNGIFTGLYVPPGAHTIVLRFIPLSFWLGVAVSVLALAAFGVVVARDLFSLNPSSVGGNKIVWGRT